MKHPRSWLFVPGDSAKKIEHALRSDADALIFDWEDAVAAANKATARLATASALSATTSASPAAARCWVRINALSSEWLLQDLTALPVHAIAGVVLPKACGPADIASLSDALQAVETRAGASPGSLSIIGIATESAASVLALSDFRGPQPRLKGLMWGGEDLAADIGVARNRDSQGRYRAPFMLARSLTIIAAAAAKCSAVDAVHVDFRKLDALAAECSEAREDGFSAKAAIHPDQVPLINQAFTASAQERQWAHKVVAQLSGGALGIVDGRMVDAPHLRLARRILDA